MEEKKPQRCSVRHGVVLVLMVVAGLSLSGLARDSDGLLHVYALDIGQGDSILVVTPSGRQVLVDGGPDGTVLTRLGQYLPPWNHDLDMIVVSHPHSDHISGLIEVLGRYRVDRVVEAGESYDSPQFVAWERAVSESHAEHIEAVAGQRIDMGDGVALDIVSPLTSVMGTTTKKPHDDTVVVMLRYGTTAMLLTGDMEASLEQRLVSAGIDLDADVLKAGHHGSKTSTSDAFLRAVTPQVAVISVGAHNTYHHPSPQVLDRLASWGIPYYRTDRNGTVSITSDGRTFSVVPTTP